MAWQLFFQKKKKVIIEANVKNLNVKGFDLDFEVDPLFKKMSAQFDEGRSTSGPFLTSLPFLVSSLALLPSEAVSCMCIMWYTSNLSKFYNKLSCL